VIEWQKIDPSGQLLTNSVDTAVFVYYTLSRGEVFFNDHWHNICYPEDFSFRQRKADLGKLFEELMSQ
jgi:hypothetical protein